MASTLAAQEAKEMRKKFTHLVDSTIRTEAFEQLMSMARWYHTIGDVEKAREVTKELQELKEKDAIARLSLHEEVEEEQAGGEEELEVLVAATSTSSTSREEDDSTPASISAGGGGGRKKKKRKKKSRRDECAVSQNLLEDDSTDHEEEEEDDDDDEEEEEDDGGGVETDDTDALVESLTKKKPRLVVDHSNQPRPRELMAQLFESPPIGATRYQYSAPPGGLYNRQV